MSRYRSLTCFAAVLILALIYVDNAEAARKLQSPPSELRIQREDAHYIQGTFAIESQAAEFTAREVTETLHTIRITVDSFSVEAVNDLAAHEIVIRADQPILQAERNVLRALTLELETSWKPYSRHLPRLQEALFNLINYVSEAPVGFLFDELRVDLSAYQLTDPGSPLEDTKTVAASSCYIDDDNDTAMSGGCSYSLYALCHDADGGGHCWACFARYAGCDESSQCLGRCGSGCGSDGSGKYRYDCGDHDDCCRVHGGCTNPFDTECGDEYFEAADDFLAGSTNCSSGCF